MLCGLCAPVCLIGNDQRPAAAHLSFSKNRPTADRPADRLAWPAQQTHTTLVLSRAPSNPNSLDREAKKGRNDVHKVHVAAARRTYTWFGIIPRIFIHSSTLELSGEPRIKTYQTLGTALATNEPNPTPTVTYPVYTPFTPFVLFTPFAPCRLDDSSHRQVDDNGTPRQFDSCLWLSSDFPQTNDPPSSQLSIRRDLGDSGVVGAFSCLARARLTLQPLALLF